MVSICPTVTALNPHTYREQVERITPFAKRIHIDFADGKLAPTKMVAPNQAWFPELVSVDVHLMLQNPGEAIETLAALKPNLIIVHAEAEGNILRFLREIKSIGARAGLALLPNSQPEEFAFEIEEADHVMIFGGNLGHHGGVADLSMLDKIPRIKQINHHVELGWDGGANDENAQQMAHKGIEVINVGGFIHKASDPSVAYAILEEKLKYHNHAS